MEPDEKGAILKLQNLKELINQDIIFRVTARQRLITEQGKTIFESEQIPLDYEVSTSIKTVMKNSTTGLSMPMINPITLKTTM